MHVYMWRYTGQKNVFLALIVELKDKVVSIRLLDKKV